MKSDREFLRECAALFRTGDPDRASRLDRIAGGGTEAERIARENLLRKGRDWPVPNPFPYVKLSAPDGRRGIEIGIGGTF